MNIMREETFKNAYLNWVDTQKRIEIVKHKPLDIFVEKELKQLLDKLDFHARQMEDFGHGTIIELTFYMHKPFRSHSTVIREKQVRMYFINVTIADVENYFKTIVKEKYKIVENRTIQIKELRAGVILDINC